ncbi:MAG: RagB/SusD family nutrient uptake outer membrane protein, partial [Salinivirgaceae bacterium]|nr:RagB/SusD family nutrient uptake outer membrane protein [Salinivirgaceae bacterium]
YSLVGIFSQLEKLAEPYVLLGELRADLMDVTSIADPDLIEIYNHDISKNNPYNNISDYYAVINNCNYLIKTIDTSLILKAEKVMYKEFAQAKAIRAWTYLQMALNYGKVKYYDDPILYINQADNYVEYSWEQLLPVLISDLEPWKSIEEPGGFSLGADLLSSSTSYIPIRFLLGDLYLWNGEYEMAAIEYHALMSENEYKVNSTYRSLWNVDNNVFVSRLEDDTDWLKQFDLKSDAIISLIASSTESEKGAPLDSISWYYPEIVVSENAIKNWENQVYYYKSNVMIEGDLRGDLGSYMATPNSFFGDIDMSEVSQNNVITKFHLLTEESAKAVTIYRTTLLYLRYAEAVNRSGKPNLALAVLKNGMNATNMATDSIVPPNEKYSNYSNSVGTYYEFVNFDDIAFDYNIGIHALGCGNIRLSNEYKIPDLNSKTDSIEWVEYKIIEELALETAFEGNRFHDLMRVSFRRGNPTYLADKVSEKYQSNKEAIRSKLTDTNNWFLP